MTAAAAAVVVAERRIVEAFESAGATSPEAARAPGDVGVHVHGLGWRRLTKRAVVRESAPGSGLYYLDREVWQAVRRTRMRMIVVVVVILLGIWFYVATVGVLRTTSNMRRAADSQLVKPPR